MKLLLILLLSIHFLYAQKIADIPEASGICFSSKSKTLFVVGDEGYVFELTTKGKILRQKYLGDYDLEGIACDTQNDVLLLANEEENSVLRIDTKNFTIIKTIHIKKKYKDIKILHKKSLIKFWEKNDGLEALALFDNTIFLANQSNKLFPKKYPSIIFSIKERKKKKAKISTIYDYRYKDISGLTFYQNHLYFLSDTADLLVKVDLEKDEVIAEYPLPIGEQEGICFDEQENIYIADDDGYILKYTMKELGL